jgi:hypothetical protein
MACHHEQRGKVHVSPYSVFAYSLYSRIRHRILSPYSPGGKTSYGFTGLRPFHLGLGGFVANATAPFHLRFTPSLITSVTSSTLLSHRRPSGSRSRSSSPPVPLARKAAPVGRAYGGPRLRSYGSYGDTLINPLIARFSAWARGGGGGIRPVAAAKRSRKADSGSETAEDRSI